MVNSPPSAAPARIRVNLVGTESGVGGIQRYRGELRERLNGSVDYVRCAVGAGPFTAVPLLRQVPLIVDGIDRRAPLHFAQIIGAGALLFGRYAPSVVTVHDLGPLVWPDERRSLSVAAWVVLKLHLSGLRRADRVIAVSQTTAQSLVEYLHLEPRRVVPILSGVDHDTFFPRSDARARVEANLGIGQWNDRKTVLVVGTELPRKNLRLVFEALSLFKARGDRVRLVKVGSPGGQRWREQTLRDIARFGIEDCVHFVQGVTDEDLAALYCAADAYVCVSLVEGFSLPTVEAMACGAPIVASAGGALPEVIQDGGLILANNRPRDLCDALDRVFTDASLRKGLESAAIRRAAHFTWDRMAEQTLRVYRSLRDLM